MTETPDVFPDSPDEDEATPESDAGVEGLGVRTGDARVDAVLDSLAGLEHRAVAEHPAVFAAAHDRLRSALDPDRQSV
jgi:hypothetical protein